MTPYLRPRKDLLQCYSDQQIATTTVSTTTTTTTAAATTTTTTTTATCTTNSDTDDTNETNSIAAATTTATATRNIWFPWLLLLLQEPEVLKRQTQHIKVSLQGIKSWNFHI